MRTQPNHLHDLMVIYKEFEDGNITGMTKYVECEASQHRGKKRLCLIMKMKTKEGGFVNLDQ